MGNGTLQIGLSLITVTFELLKCQYETNSLDCLVHLCVWDKRRVSEIDLSQPRYETAFWWRHNRPATSQLTDPITLPSYPLELISIYVLINTKNK